MCMSFLSTYFYQTLVRLFRIPLSLHDTHCQNPNTGQDYSGKKPHETAGLEPKTPGTEIERSNHSAVRLGKILG